MSYSQFPNSNDCYRSGSQSNLVIPSLEGTDPLLMDSYSLRTDNVVKCARVAMGRGFKLFAVHIDGQCLSSATAADNLNNYDPNTCNGHAMRLYKIHDGWLQVLIPIFINILWFERPPIDICLVFS